MAQKKHVFFAGITYIVPEHMERWLEALALQGWYPEKIDNRSGLVMTFMRGEPRQMRYVFDSPDVIGPEYEAHYKKHGWELTGQTGDALIWRAPYSGERRPETFADPKDIGRHNRRFYGYLSTGFMLCTFLMAMLTMIIWRTNTATPGWYMAAIIMGDVAVFGLIGLLRHTQKKMELGDRIRSAPPDTGETNRLV